MHVYPYCLHQCTMNIPIKQFKIGANALWHFSLSMWPNLSTLRIQQGFIDLSGRRSCKIAGMLNDARLDNLILGCCLCCCCCGRWCGCCITILSLHQFWCGWCWALIRIEIRAVVCKCVLIYFVSSNRKHTYDQLNHESGGRTFQRAMALDPIEWVVWFHLLSHCWFGYWTCVFMWLGVSHNTKALSSYTC